MEVTMAAVKLHKQVEAALEGSHTDVGGPNR